MDEAAVAGAVAAALRAEGCGAVPELIARLGVRDGPALLARLGCTGNHAALWEGLTEGVALRPLPDDELTPLIAAWLPHPEALREFGARALAAGADPA